MAGPGWWDRFFGGAWDHVQREAHSPEQSAATADWIAEALDLRPGESLLDAPCGFGRLAIPLARRGVRVTGIDFSGPAVEEARASAVALGAVARFERHDLRELPYEDEFDAALCWWGSFGYFSEEDEREHLRGVVRALRPGGRWLLDTHVTETLLPMMEPRGWHRAGDTLVLELRSWDHVTSRAHCEWTFVRNGQIDRAESSIRVYTHRELTALLREAGFSEVRTLPDAEGEPFGLGSRRARVVAVC